MRANWCRDACDQWVLTARIGSIIFTLRIFPRAGDNEAGLKVSPQTAGPIV